jgi:hypothetical protein
MAASQSSGALAERARAAALAPVASNAADAVAGPSRRCEEAAQSSLKVSAGENLVVSHGDREHLISGLSSRFVGPNIRL